MDFIINEYSKIGENIADSVKSGDSPLHLFWAKWFGDVGRGVGNPQRDFVGNNTDFINWIEANERQGRCSYASVQNFNAYEQVYSLDKCFFDFDCKESPEKAEIDALNFVRTLMNSTERIIPFIAFSGKKGYHVYTFLQQPFGLGMEKQALKEVYGTLQRMLLGFRKYATLDSSVIGDIAQLARIPYTHHEKSKKLCLPVDVHGNDLEPNPMMVDVHRKNGVSFDLCKEALYLTGRTKKKEEKLRNQRKPKLSKFYRDQMRPCIKEALKRSHVSHKMRVAMMAELHASGWGLNRIVDAFSGLIDFDRRKTEYYVKHAIRQGYKPFRCSTIQRERGCLLEACPIYRRRRR